MRYPSLLAAALVAILGCASRAQEVFVGPLAGWMNLKTEFGAVGDGKADDTDAIQKALDALRPDDRKRFVLYIPAGTYRITRTLVLLREKHAEAMNITIVGEDPATTTLRWDGEAGGILFDYGAWYSVLGRLTFDGAGKAKTAIAHGKRFVTYNEMHDLVFRDVEFGIEAGAKGGQGIAETTVWRCRFINCGRAGISIQNFNSLDWWVWDSLFEDCGTGVTNTFGAGNFHLYRSIFKRSTVADASIGNTAYFSLRFNTSVGSKVFFKAGGIGASGLLTLQGNTVFGTQETAVQVGNHGPVLLLDNTFHTSQSPTVKVNPVAGFVSAGNAFSVADPISAKPGIRLDDKVTPAGSFIEPTMPPAPARFTGPVIEVPASSDAGTIAEAIAQAQKVRGQRPVVHLPAGKYAIDRTIEFPADSDVQLIGDGSGATQFAWTGQGNGPVLRIHGPTRVSLRGLSINGAGRADGLIVEGCDQPGARLWMDQANVTSAKSVGLLADGLKRADVNLLNFEHAGNKLGLKVIGGRASIFGGASSDNELCYDLADGGRLIAWDIWYETNRRPVFLNLAGSGAFTLNGAIIAVPQKDNTPAIVLDGFRGDVTFLTTVFVGGGNAPSPVLVKGEGPNLLMLGVQVGMGEGHLVNQSPTAKAGLRESFIFLPGGGSKPLADQGDGDDAFVRRMLAPTRAQRLPDLRPLPEDVTDLRLHRVSVSNAQTCIHLRP